MYYLSFCLDISVSWIIFGVLKIIRCAGQILNKNLKGSVTKFGVKMITSLFICSKNEKSTTEMCMIKCVYRSACYN